MTTISDNLLNAVNGVSAGAAKGKDTVSEAQDRFLTLLVTQMKNQDPLNPMENAELTSQLAQLSTVSGIEKMNSALETLLGSYQSSQALQAASLIGHGVMVPGNSTELQDGTALMGIELAQPADRVKVTVRDTGGNVVHTFTLENQSAGIYPMAWDGKTDEGSDAVSGRYTFDVEATTGGQNVEATALSFGQVASVTTAGQGVRINVPGLGDLAFSDVRQIL